MCCVENPEQSSKKTNRGCNGDDVSFEIDDEKLNSIPNKDEVSLG